MIPQPLIELIQSYLRANPAERPAIEFDLREFLSRCLDPITGKVLDGEAVITTLKAQVTVAEEMLAELLALPDSPDREAIIEERIQSLGEMLSLRHEHKKGHPVSD